MHKMANLEYAFMVQELAPRVVGRHFSRIRKVAEGIYRIKIGDSEILCQAGIRLHETRYIEKSEQTDKFAEKISKELDNAKLISLGQINNDRIIEFTFDRGRLIFEMFGDGNIVLVRDGITVCAYRYESWSDRNIKAGSSYAPPKPSVTEQLEVSDRFIIVSLMKMPFGKDYAAEALSHLGIDEKTPGNQLAPDQINRIEVELRKIRDGAKPVVFYQGGKPVDFALVDLARYSKLEKREFASLGDAADEYYANMEQPNPEVEKLMRRLEKQKEHLQELLEEEKANRSQGDYIYAHYVEIERILGLAAAGKFEEIEKIPNQKIKVIKIDKKEKSVEVELPD